MSVKHPEYLEAEIVLDNPEYLHHGNGKAIIGHLALTYHCVGSASELSGLLTASVHFRGCTKAEIRTGQGSKWTNGSSLWYGKLTPYTGQDILFDFSREIYNGPCRAICDKTLRLPFVLNFPDSVKRPVNSKGWDPARLLSSQPDDQLPSSGSCRYESHDPVVNASIEYRVGAQVAMRDNAIPIYGLDETSLPQVHYERGYTPPSEGLVVVHDIESRRAFLYRPSVPWPARSPSFRCECIMQCLQSLYLDQPIVVKIIVIPSADCPDFTAKIRVDIDLESFTEIHAGNTLGRSRKGCLREEYRVAGYDHQPGSGQRLEPLSNTNEYSTTATSKSISGIASTFFTRSMSRWYTLRIRIMFDSSEYYNNGNELLGYHSFPVVLMPPVAGSASAETVLRPFGRRYWLFDHMYEKPTMTNRFSVPSGNAVLPKYEQPPSYDTLSKEKAGGGAPDTKPTKGKTSKHD